MDKLPMCRICLVKNVRMYVVVNKSLHELYEKLTDVPFVTEDSRPILACSFCCAKLMQCFRFMRKCLEAEELFTQMMDEEYKPNPSMNIDHEFYSGFSVRQIEHISIIDGCQTEIITVKEELPDVCERQYDIIEPNEEYQSDEALVMKKPKLDTGSIKVELEIEQNKQSNSEDICTTENRTSERKEYWEKPYKCDQRDLNQVKHLKQKIRTGISDISFKCDVCQRIFWRKDSLIKHLRIHTGEKPYSCDVCQLNFRQKGNLTIHKRIHTGDRRFMCDFCQRSFIKKTNLESHIRTHTGDKPFKCDVCQRSYVSNSALKEHIVKHTNAKFKCELCQRYYSTSFELKKHILLHSSDKSYNCNVCQRSFVRKAFLTAHIRIHSSEKSYKCDVCQCAFIRKSHLTRHNRTHTGEKPYSCNVCQRSFSRKSHLTTHSKTHK